MNFPKPTPPVNKIVYTIITVLALFLSLNGCENPVTDPDDSAIAVTGVSLNKSSLALMTGEAERLIATVEPLNATNKVLSWSSSGGAASVSETGWVTAVSAGEAEITATTVDGAFVSSCSVTVSDPPQITVTGVTLNKTTTVLVVGSTEQLSAIITPDNALNREVLWSSDNASVSVTSSGLIRALAVGTATVTVTTVEGNFSASCVVTVTPVRVTGISLNKTTTSIGLGFTEQLSALILPANATNKAVSWTSSSANATVSEAGLVTAVSLGSATITATSDDGSFTASCLVSVIPVPVTGILLNKTSMTLVAGQSELLTATINPATAANKNITWNSSDTHVAAVSQGQVLAFAAGTATITVRTEDGGFTATCVVTVTGTLSHSYEEVIPAATALQNGLNAAIASNDPTSSAYALTSLTPSLQVTCYFNNFVDSGYTLNGSVVITVNPNYTQGPMNGTVYFSGGVVSEISYINAVFTTPMSGSLGIRFTDNTSGSLNLATGVYTQN